MNRQKHDYSTNLGVSVEKSFNKLINMLYQESFIVFNLDPLVKLSVREFTQIRRKNFCFLMIRASLLYL